MWITFIVIIIKYIYILPAGGDKVGALVGDKVGTIYIIIRIIVGHQIYIIHLYII